MISFADEESAFLELAGSRSFCGSLSDADIDGARNREGVQLAAALAEAGWAERPRARLDPSRHVAYLEAHIEQGPRLEALEAQDRRIGVVTSIVGIRRVQVTFRGQADHAGTTPMHLRRDAGAALIDFCHDLRTRLETAGDAESVWNLGRVGFEPGAANVVPAKAQVLIEYRDPSAALLDRIEAEIASAVAAADGRGGVRASATPLAAVPPTQLDAALADVIARAAHGRGQRPLRMTSGAGHDAMTLSPHLPSAMLFVPSIGGRSHDLAEDTAEADIVLGAQVMADASSSVDRARSAGRTLSEIALLGARVAQELSALDRLDHRRRHHRLPARVPGANPLEHVIRVDLEVLRPNPRIARMEPFSTR